MEKGRKEGRGERAGWGDGMKKESHPVLTIYLVEKVELQLVVIFMISESPVACGTSDT